VTARDCLAAATSLGEGYQLAINQFADDFRRASPDGKRALVEAPIAAGGQLEALLAAVVSFLCHEAGIGAPSWVEAVVSPAPMFVLPARSFEMRLRLMLESPPPFRNRLVFVPEDYLSRA
jgi:hypothetical protein